MNHENMVNSFVFSPDGKWVTSSWDGTARVWLWAPEDLIDLSCVRLTRNLTQKEWDQYACDLADYRPTRPNLPKPSE